MSVASELAKAAIEAARGRLNDLSAHTVAKKIGDYPVEFKDPVLGDEFVAVPMNTPEGFGYVQKDTLYQYDLNKPVEYDEFNMVRPQDYAEMSSEGGDLVADTLKQGRAEDAVTRRGQMREVGLPMDYASRMARAAEQGFDTSPRGKHFHGGVNELVHLEDRPMFFARDPSSADEFAGAGEFIAPGDFGEAVDEGISVGGQVTPAFLSIRNPIDTTTKAGQQAFEDILGDLGVAVKEADWDSGYLLSESVDGAELSQRLVKNAYSNPNDLVYQPEFIAAARRRGYDGLVGRDGLGMDMVDISIPFSAAKQVRSPHAAFDPANAGKNDLLGAATPSRLAATALAGGVGVAAVRSFVPEGDRWTTEMADAWDAQRREVIDSVLSAVGEGLVSVDDAITGLVNYAFGPKKYFHSTGGDSTAGADAINALRPGVRTLGEGLAEQDPEKIGLGLLL